MDIPNNDTAEGESISNPGHPVVEWAPPQDRGSFYGVVPNVLGGARSYTELWRCGHDRPSLRSGGGVERIPCLCTCELEERRLAHESTRTNDRTGDEDKEDNLGITERQPPTLCQPV